MTTTAPVDSASEAAALKYGRDLRKFVMHSTVYVLVCSSILAVNLWLAPDQLAAPFVWLIWGIGLAIHAAGTFVFNGVWERRRVERKLGRPL
jgi:predicted membrane channel-forming protein YqfA (hemolysin III family)